MTVGSDNPFPSVLFAEHIDPANPSAGTQRLFVDTDHILKMIDSAGTVTTFNVGGAIANPLATDSLWDAAGDLVQGSGANTAAKLSAGTAGKVLTSNGAAAALTWETPASAPAYAAWTPALSASTPPTLGSGSTAVGRYFQTGKYVHAYGAITFGSSGVNAGSGTYTISLPVTARAVVSFDMNELGFGTIFDSSASALRGVHLRTGSTTTATVFVIDGSTAVTNGSPWTWAASDVLMFQMHYEAA